MLFYQSVYLYFQFLSYAAYRVYAAYEAVKAYAAYIVKTFKAYNYIILFYHTQTVDESFHGV